MIRPDDPQLTVELVSDIAALGSYFSGHIRRSPVDGAANAPGRGQVRAVRVGLYMFTQGRGDEDSWRSDEIEAPVDEHGMASAPFRLPVPHDMPISYDGALIRVRWQIEVRTDRKMALDSVLSADVLVVARRGEHLYQRPHPL